MRPRVGVVGVGYMGKFHARVLSEIEEAELAGVCDLDAARAREIADVYRVPHYSDVSRFLDELEIDAVSICTPTSTHRNVALEAIERGKHLLVEKPMCSSTAEATEIVSAAERRGLVLMVGYVERFNPGVMKTRDMIMKGELGRVFSIHSVRVGPRPQRIRDADVILDTATHDLDVIRYLYDAEPMRVFAVGGAASGSMNDHVQALMEFPGGVSGFVEASWLSPLKLRELEVKGAGGTLRMDYIKQEVSLLGEGGFLHVDVRPEEPLKVELRHFVRCVDGGMESESPGTNGVMNLKVIDDVFRSLSRMPESLA